VVAKNRPKRILLCMIYYLDEQPGGSWADHVLSKFEALPLMRPHTPRFSQSRDSNA
jgi:hypothetical protein